MAGGVKKPVNIFKLRNLDDPKEVFNWRLWFAVMSFGLMGAARGIDEGTSFPPIFLPISRPSSFYLRTLRSHMLLSQEKKTR
jgi:hypothetical protein